jgi:periplasmic protein TonB
MKPCYYFLLIQFFWCIQLSAQVKKTVPDYLPPPLLEKEIGKINSDEKFERVEVEAEFPGGIREWSRFLQKNLNANVPVDNRARKGKYTVIIRFVVDKEGKVSDIVAETNHGHGMEKEVMRVIALGPNWTPAMQDGRIVKAYRRQPVTFMVE